MRPDLRKKTLLFPIFISICASSFASPLSYSFWIGAKATSTYQIKPIVGASINDEFFNITLEQIYDTQTRLYADVTFKNNKTLRQDLITSANYTYTDGLDFNLSYLVGQDLKASVFYLDYRLGLQLSVNYSIPTKSGQVTLSPTMILDTGLAFKYAVVGVKVASITPTESSLQTLPVFNPYIGCTINKLAITLGPEIKLADYSFDRIYPVISTSIRLGIAYKGGDMQ